MKIILTCNAGHTWERESQRGRRPIACPAHDGHAPADLSAAVDRETEDSDVETFVPLSGSDRAANLMIMLAALPKTRTVIEHAGGLTTRVRKF